ncbi:E3 ubiquitin-protein ligase ZSWIM2 [Myotis davidii]|uniref:E3 ubiquitin-protein ligase ZSWIM2 n=1 Tax=Myotis davidii TaxID=225400 RepID=L5LNS6_MYODS|nr:E3 ubiquitin-protein ligase ZSWIM2 [Myotis davidii]
MERLPAIHVIDNYAFDALQLGLVEGEIDDLLRGVGRLPSAPKPANDPRAHTEGDGGVKRKEVGPEDICSICQELLLEKRLPVTFCRFGCGNNVHIKCMKILAKYQDAVSSTSMLKCPLCREDFAPLSLILEEFKNASKLVTVAEKERLDKQLGIPCNSCRLCPIEGRCYKCTQCEEYHLCQDCFPSCSHGSHAFTFREVSVPEGHRVGPLGNGMNQVHTPRPVVRSLPLLMITKNSKLLGPGFQCRLCLQAFCPSQYARLLPCSHKGPPGTTMVLTTLSALFSVQDFNPRDHSAAADTETHADTERTVAAERKFHRKCIDSWLLHKSNACPIDGQVIYNPLLWKDTAVNGRGHRSVPNTGAAYLSKQEQPGLFVPGTGLVIKQHGAGTLPSIHQRNSETSKTPQRPTDIHQEMTTGDLYAINVDDANSRRLIYEYKIRQHFPRYFHDLPTGSFGRIPSQTFLPSIARENNICPPGTGGPRVNDAGQSQKLTKGSQRINHNLKKILGANIREENRRPNTSRRFRSYCQLGYN